MRRVVLFLLLAAVTAFAQTNQPVGPTAILPVADPGSEVASWDGRSWNITNNRLFQSRFERYLSTPSDINEDTTEHFKVLSQVRELLSPSKISLQSRQEAFRLLEKASDYEADDLLSDAIANQVYSAWLAQRNTALLQSATEALQQEKKRLEWNMQMIAGGNPLNRPTTAAAPLPGQPAGAPTLSAPPRDGRQALALQQINARLVEINALLKNNDIKKEISWSQARTDFQVLIVQLFLQRRFLHVLIATRFYRSIFADGSTEQVKLGEDAQSFFAKTTGSAPTLTSLETLCGELIGDAHDGVAAFRSLLASREMESASRRLAEAFLIGEYLTSLDTVSLAEKHQALVFTQKSNQLLNALDVKDYALAEKLVNALQVSAKDFDTAKAGAAIQNAKTTAALHLARARNAAASGDKEKLEAELDAAAAVWPTNPELAETASGIFKQENVQARALAEFDQLVAQRAWRRIYEERMRLIPAIATDPEKQAKMEEILADVAVIDRAKDRAAELEKRGEPFAAWEATEIVARQFPEEYPKFAKYRAELALRAIDYVHAIRTAEDLEARGERGSSLSWYLQAQIIYPPGELAKAGIQRLNHLILPDSW